MPQQVVDQELYLFVHDFFGTFGICSGYCEICKEQHPACEGEKYVDGQCPKDCDGLSGVDFHSVSSTYERQVGECCFEKIFRRYKDFLDEYKPAVLRYYVEEVEKERERLKREENLLFATKK